jgi:phage shock protein A
VFSWFVRIVRGFFGKLFSSIEDPEATLQQLMRDMHNKVPKLRMAVAQAYANRRLAEQDLKETESELTRIERQIPEAIKGGDRTREAALLLISRKKQLQQQLGDKQNHMELTTAQAEKAQELLNDFQSEMDGKFTHIRGLIAKHKQIAVQEEYAKVMQAFEVGDDSHVLEDVERRITERAARAQGMVDVISNEPGAQLREVQKSSRRIEAEQEYEEYARQLGLMPAATDESGASKVLQPAQQEPPQPQQQTTQQP